MAQRVSVYRPQMRVPVYQAPEVRPVDVSSGLRSVADDLSQIAQRERASALQDAELGMAEDFSTLKEELRRLPWNEKEKTFVAKAMSIQSKRVNASGDRWVRDQAMASYRRQMLAHQEGVRADVFEGQASHERARTDEALERFAKDAAAAQSPDERALALEGMEKAVGNLVAAGFMDEARGRNALMKAKGDADLLTGKTLIDKNPWAAARTFGNAEAWQRMFPHLDPLQAEALKDEARREGEHREAQARARAAEQRAMSAKVEADRLEAEKKLTELVGALNLVGSGAPLDPRSAQDRKAVDLAWNAKAETVEENMKLPALIGFADQVGMVPDAGKKLIRGMLRSGNDQTVLAAVETIGRIKTVNPELLNDFAKEDLNLATSVLAQADGGVDPAMALRRYREGLQVDETTRKVRAQHFNEAVKAAPDDAARTLREATGGESSWWALLGGEWRTDADVPAEAAEEFNRLRREEFVRTGNMDGATRFAKDSVARVYGVTQLGGGRAVTKYAPEKLYGSPKLSLKENADWIEGQARAEAKAVLGEVPEGRLSLTPAKRVGPDGRPGYVITITTEDGRMVTPERNGRPLLFVPDFKSSPAAAAKKAEEQQAIDAARQAKEWERRTGNLPKEF